MHEIPVEPSANTRPLWLGAVVAPWSAPILLACLAVLADGSRRAAHFVEIGVWAIVVGLPISAAGFVFLLLPWVLWLTVCDRLVVWRVLAVGVPAGGLLLLGLVAAIGSRSMPWETAWTCFGLGALSGCTVALVFCLVSGVPWRATSRR